MAVNGGPRVYDGVSAKENLKQDCETILFDRRTNSPVITEKVWCDVTTDATYGWFCVFMAFPRDSDPYNSSRIGSTPPKPSDTSQNKLSDTDIQKILNNDGKETRTQWYHTSEADGSVWANGSLTNGSTLWNLFETPSNWNSTSTSGGQRFKRKQGANDAYTDWITSAAGGCSGAVGGWSNYYEQSCTVSWFAGCEGKPAWYHCCACPVDRASKLIIWAR